jgi:hypothetical protein
MLHGIYMDGCGQRPWHRETGTMKERRILPDGADSAALFSWASSPFMV